MNKDKPVTGLKQSPPLLATSDYDNSESQPNPLNSAAPLADDMDQPLENLENKCLSRCSKQHRSNGQPCLVGCWNCE